MDQTVIGVLFVSAVAAAIVAVLDAVKQRAENATTKKRNIELELQLVSSENKWKSLESQLSLSQKPDDGPFEPDATVD